MTTQIADRVVETTTTTGAGTYTLAGAKAGSRSFAAAVTAGDLADGDTVYYYCTDGTDWEVGSGVFTVATLTLTRATIARSSNAGSAVNWGAGSKDVVSNMPAAELQKLIDTSWGATTMTHARGTLTADDKVSNRTVTLNQSATIFNVDKDDVTDTASATETRLKSWYVGGVLKTSIRKDGALHHWNGANDASNYERGFMRWASNVLEIGAEASGTGIERAVSLLGASVKFRRSGLSQNTTMSWVGASFTLQGDTAGQTLDLAAPSGDGTVISVGGSSAASKWCWSGNTTLTTPRSVAAKLKAYDTNLDLAPTSWTIEGSNAFATAATNLIGGSINILAGSGASSSAGLASGGSINLNGGQGYGTGAHGNILLGTTRGLAVVNKGYTVATLPAGVLGAMARVTDSLAPAVGVVVAAGGAANALVWYNGAQWTVVSI